MAKMPAINRLAAQIFERKSPPVQVGFFFEGQFLGQSRLWPSDKSASGFDRKTALLLKLEES